MPQLLDSVAIRQGFVYLFLILYCIYAVYDIGVAGLLFSLAIGLILLSLEFPVELSVAIVILSGLVWRVTVVGKRLYQGFESGRQLNDDELPTKDDLDNMTKKINPNKEGFSRQDLSGLLSSNYVEGFADADPKKAEENTPSPSTSTPASVNAPSATTALAAAMPNAPAAPAAPAQTSGFSDKLTDGMFKLGSIPPDAVGGAHIDVGTTLMNALNSLKPDQVKQMTEDSRKLMETQKSLMGMLTTIKPMIQDGKQMMDTFQEMFGNQK